MARNKKARNNKRVRSKNQRVNLTVTPEGKRIFNRLKQHQNVSEAFDRWLKREYGSDFQNPMEEFEVYKRRLGKLYSWKQEKEDELRVEFESKKYAIMKKLDEVSERINEENPEKNLSTNRAENLKKGIMEENPELAEKLSA